MSTERLRDIEQRLKQIETQNAWLMEVIKNLAKKGGLVLPQEELTFWGKLRRKLRLG